MTVKAIHWRARVREDGTSQIFIYVYHQGKKKYYSTGINVLPNQWSASKQLIVGLPQYIKDSYNAIIETKKMNFYTKLADGIPIDQLETVQEKDRTSLLEFLNVYIKEMDSGLHGVQASTIKSYRSLRTRLYQYCDHFYLSDLGFKDVDMDWYRHYFQWVKDSNLGLHGFDRAIKNLKKVLRIASERGLHDNKIYQHPEFKQIRRPSGDKIYLNKEEIEKVEQLDLSTLPYLARERDRFLISYYFVMRWEDSTLINKDSIIEHSGLNYGYTAKKTGTHCIVPISSKARILLEKRKYQFDADSNQKANQKIKEIGMLSGINQIVTQNGVKAPKYKFITTHTARRSAATNLYLEGMDLETIARIGGWKKLETLKIYLRASGLEVAQNAKKFDFFK